MEFDVVSIFLIVVCGYLLFTISKLNSRLDSLEYSLRQFNNINLSETSLMDEELRLLIEEGNDVIAVKRLRKYEQLSLVEAKKYIDNLKNER